MVMMQTPSGCMVHLEASFAADDHSSDPWSGVGAGGAVILRCRARAHAKGTPVFVKQGGGGRWLQVDVHQADRDEGLGALQLQRLDRKHPPPPRPPIGTPDPGSRFSRVCIDRLTMGSHSHRKSG
jgi:hypothetical protein